MEKDDEFKGEGCSYDFGARILDPRVGRFLSVNPLAPKYPGNSTYAFSENRVISAIEIEGLEASNLNGERIKNLEQGQQIQRARDESWQDLKDFQVPMRYYVEANTRLWEAKHRSEFWPGSRIEPQPIRETGTDYYSVDYFSVVITELPSKANGEKYTPFELFDGIRKNLSFVKRNSNSTFGPYEQSPESESALWGSDNPLTAVMQFDVYQGPFQVDDLTVLTTAYYVDKDNNNYFWVFTPVWAAGNSYHPLAGHRQFGLIETVNAQGVSSYTFYLRALDTPYTIVDNVTSPLIYHGANSLWEQTMRNVRDLVVAGGGKANIGKSTQFYPGKTLFK